jgi:hypothetical protein
MIIDPRHLNVVEWTDYMGDELTGYAAPPRLDDATQWRAWALIVVQAPAIAVSNPPDPRHFSDWRDWAMRFQQAVTVNT